MTMARKLKSQSDADKKYESKRVNLCDAQGSKEEQTNFREACKTLGLTQREALKIVLEAAKNK